MHLWKVYQSVYTAYINCDLLYTYEHGVVFERSYIMHSWAECLPFSRLFTLKTNLYCDHSALISFLSYSALEMSPYVAIQSPSLCLFQILWRPQALLLLFQLPWIPPARQLIGGNNKLRSSKPLTNLSPKWRSKRLPISSLTHWHNYCMHTHIVRGDKLRLTHTQSEQRWPLDDSGTAINVISFSTIQSHCHHLSIYPSGAGEMCEINSAFI